MSDHALGVELTLPFVWIPDSAGTRDAQPVWRETLLVLRLLLTQDAAPLRDGDHPGGLERLEAKVDLVLHLLTRPRTGAAAPLHPTPLVLQTDGLVIPQGLSGDPAQGDSGLVLLDPGSPSPLALGLPVHLVHRDGAGTVLAWRDPPPELSDPWTQWLFRQHRRAIQAGHHQPVRDGPD